VRTLAPSLLAAAFLAGVGGAAVADGLGAAVGKAVFDRIWVGGGASTQSADGLGPLHNARSCAGCHRGGGAAAISLNDKGELAGAGLVLRLADAAGRRDAVYGDQLQTRGLPGQAAEATVVFALTEAAFGDEPGPRVTARISALSHGPIIAATGVRRAPSLTGRAAFEQVDVAAILALSDPADRDGDGVSGRVHWVGDQTSGLAIGRYGWRATGATLDRQIAAAFAVDLGLSTEAFPDPAGDCTSAQKDCRNARHGDAAGGPEVEPRLTAAVAAYLATLRPRQAIDGQGERLFVTTGCAACHVPSLPVAGGASAADATVDRVPAAAPTVPAFTDLLLHDMGEGLADPVTVPGVAPSEWRTAPLVGLVGRDPKTRRYLHDARAKNLDEAIGWHGGEAERARAAYEALAEAERLALLAYLEAL
jgi:CxxC motif-containing protein (DUF1111 family)